MKQSRNTETREEQTREYTYEEPNLLDIPDSVYDRFLSQGLALRWIRISLKGDDDYKNVGRKTQQGYEFVDPKEVPEMLPTSIVVDKGRYENCVVRGDVVMVCRSDQKQKCVRRQGRLGFEGNATKGDGL